MCTHSLLLNSQGSIWWILTILLWSKVVGKSSSPRAVSWERLPAKNKSSCSVQCFITRSLCPWIRNGRNKRHRKRLTELYTPLEYLNLRQNLHLQYVFLWFAPFSFKARKVTIKRLCIMWNDTFYLSYLFPKEVALQRNGISLKARVLPSFMNSLWHWRRSKYFSSQKSRHI